MTLLTFNGFEGYSDPVDQRDASDFINYIQRASGGGLVYSTGRNGGKALKWINEGVYTCGVRFTFSSIDNTKTAICGFAIKFGGGFPALEESVVIFGEGVSAYGGFEATLISSGVFRLKIKSYTSSLASYDLVVTTGQWYYIEVKVRIHDTLGVGIVRVDEQEVINFSGDTKSNILSSSTIQHFQLDFLHNSFMELDDVYVADDQGTENNDFLGDIRIDAVHPNGAGNYTDLTPSTGSNYQCVDETELDESDYVEGANVGDKDSYSYQNVPTDLDDSGIIALQIKNNAKRTATATNIKIDPFIRTGSTDYSQTVENLPDEFSMVNGDILLEDPSDSNAWTQVKINACEFGMEVA